MDEYTFAPLTKDPAESRIVELSFYGKAANFWLSNELYPSSEFIRPDPATGFSYEATTGGTSGNRPPVWPKTVGQTIVDGSVTWTCRDASTNGLNAISGPSGVSDPTGLTISGVSVHESVKILTTYAGGVLGQDYDAVFTFTLNGLTRTARQTVKVRKR